MSARAITQYSSYQNPVPSLWDLTRKTPPIKSVASATDLNPPAVGTRSDTACPRLIETGRAEVVEIMARDSQASSLSRREIADYIGVNVATLDSWLARGRVSRNIPVPLLPAWCRATGSRRTLEWAAGQCGMHLVDDATLALAEVGKLTLEIREREERLRHLMARAA